MKITTTPLPGVLLVEPRVFGDARGFFFELYHAKRYGDAGIPTSFVQDNYSRSGRGILRGLHYQEPRGQGKLVQVVVGAVYDVVVDIRRGSPAFGKWWGTELSAEGRRQLWIPAGLAHGFCVLTDSADFVYKCTEYYAPDCEHTIAWNDPDVGIRWPVETPVLSTKDAAGVRLKDAKVLPEYGAQRVP